MLTVAKLCTGPCKQYSNRICMVAIKRVVQTKKNSFVQKFYRTRSYVVSVSPCDGEKPKKLNVKKYQHTVGSLDDRNLSVRFSNLSMTSWGQPGT